MFVESQNSLGRPCITRHFHCLHRFKVVHICVASVWATRMQKCHPMSDFVITGKVPASRNAFMEMVTDKCTRTTFLLAETCMLDASLRWSPVSSVSRRYFSPSPGIFCHSTHSAGCDCPWPLLADCPWPLLALSVFAFILFFVHNVCTLHLVVFVIMCVLYASSVCNNYCDMHCVNISKSCLLPFFFASLSCTLFCCYGCSFPDWTFTGTTVSWATWDILLVFKMSTFGQMSCSVDIDVVDYL